MSLFPSWNSTYTRTSLSQTWTLSPPQLFHTHFPFTSLPQPVIDSQCRIVYICRNPKDVFVSFFFFSQAKSPSLSIEEEFEQFCKGVRVYGPFWDHILGYWKASLDSPKRVLFMKYEDLKRDSSFHVKELAEFIGCPFSRRKKPKVWKGEFGDWKNHLTAEMADSLDRIIEEKFTGSGLTFSDS
ncbi:Cytosolic sulfotransferase 10 [Vitis vinifera]|uniref:Sulfotransferase n=1 Tax=Vitis vinifera TaxID=29760 RepID=A0A438C9R6_VITVI|nr:Cytosolic sulfotransferase 10 [Vitis vinifera]